MKYQMSSVSCEGRPINHKFQREGVWGSLRIWYSRIWYSIFLHSHNTPLPVLLSSISLYARASVFLTIHTVYPITTYNINSIKISIYLYIYIYTSHTYKHNRSQSISIKGESWAPSTNAIHKRHTQTPNIQHVQAKKHTTTNNHLRKFISQLLYILNTTIQ